MADSTPPIQPILTHPDYSTGHANDALKPHPDPRGTAEMASTYAIGTSMPAANLRGEFRDRPHLSVGNGRNYDADDTGTADFIVINNYGSRVHRKDIDMKLWNHGVFLKQRVPDAIVVRALAKAKKQFVGKAKKHFSVSRPRPWQEKASPDFSSQNITQGDPALPRKVVLQAA